MKEKTFEVTLYKTVKVQIDETKFDEKFFDEFCESFWEMRGIDKHMEYLAEKAAYDNESIGLFSSQFIEGYGPSEEMGIRIEVTDEDIFIDY